MDETKMISITMLVFFIHVLSANFSLARTELYMNKTTVEIQPTAASTSSILFRIIGSVYPLGQFYVSINIGNPPKTYLFDIDTGSDLTWLQCEPCNGCTLPPERRYTPHNNFVPCNNPFCIHGGGETCEDPQKCSFKNEYADETEISGVLVTDSLAHTLTNGSTAHSNLIFGCVSKYKLGIYPEIITASGTLALGKNKIAIPSQLRAAGLTQNVIGHCLSHTGGGFLFIGDDLVPSSGVTWLPMSQKAGFLSKHYALGPADLLLDGIPTGIKSLDVVFDAGSTYTYFPSATYESIMFALALSLSGKPLTPDTTDRTLAICMKGPEPFKSVSDFQAYFPTFTLNFTATAQLQLPPETYLVISNFGNACVGILNGTELELPYNVIGDISMVDKIFVYDNENQRIGWSSGNCFPPVQ